MDCPVCYSDRTIKWGRTRGTFTKNQRWRCTWCGKTFVQHPDFTFGRRFCRQFRPKSTRQLTLDIR